MSVENSPGKFLDLFDHVNLNAQISPDGIVRTVDIFRSSLSSLGTSTITEYLILFMISHASADLLLFTTPITLKNVDYLTT